MFTNLIQGAGKFTYPYSIDQSCRFNDDDSAYTTIAALGSPTNANIWTFSTWVKRANIIDCTIFSSADDVNNRGHIRFNNSNIQLFSRNTGGTTCQIDTVAVLRDVSSWYHIIVSVDTTQAVAADRVTIYINGVEQSQTITTSPTQNNDIEFNLNQDHFVSSNGLAGSFLDGYLAETIFVDGQALTPSSFGLSKKGIWVPKAYTGSYGDNGFYLDYSNASHFGEDQSGNGNDFTDSGLATNDQVEDTPTNNWCVLNSVLPEPNSWHTWSDGNLVATQAVTNNASLLWKGTFLLPKTGKWYWECDTVFNQVVYIGISTPEENTENLCGALGGYAFSSAGSNLYHGAAVIESDTPAWNSGDLIGFAFDVDNDTLQLYINNSLSYTYPSIASGVDYVVGGSKGGASSTTTMSFDFGQLGFTYTPPAGYKALNWENVTNAMQLNESLYFEGNKGFDTILYEGTGAEKAITDLVFSPDLVWIKNRDAADEHVLTDSVRGATEELNSDSANAESTVAQGVKFFDSAGFTLGTQAEYNTLNESYVAWNWKEDPNYGFDIVSYTGTGVAKTEAHNLGVVPEMMIVKNRDQADSWAVYHKDNTAAPETDWLKLDLTDATADLNTIWNDTAPTSSLFTVGTAHNVNASGEDYIAYLFASVEGFSKVFSYVGNGSADGPFVYCGFRPKFMIWKNATSAQNWYMMDTERDTYNIMDSRLYPNLSVAEDSAGLIDYLSNGFKVRNSSVSLNESSSTIVGIAFAETPFPWANAR